MNGGCQGPREGRMGFIVEWGQSFSFARWKEFCGPTLAMAAHHENGLRAELHTRKGLTRVSVTLSARVRPDLRLNHHPCHTKNRNRLLKRARERWMGWGCWRENRKNQNYRCEGGDLGISMLVHVEVWQKTTKFRKAIILQLKKKKNTGVGCLFLLQGIFPTQGLNPCLLHILHCRQILYHWATLEALYIEPYLGCNH